MLAVIVTIIVVVAGVLDVIVQLLQFTAVKIVFAFVEVAFVLTICVSQGGGEKDSGTQIHKHYN